MKHFLLKFNHGVEIGAYLAYVGHARRTKSRKVHDISLDELRHRGELKRILNELGHAPNPFINGCFTLVGKMIQTLCKFSPLWSLDLVARTMEMFAIFNYEKLAKKYPKYGFEFRRMAKAEKDHEEYFRLGPVKYQELQNLKNALVSGGPLPSSVFEEIDLSKLKWVVFDSGELKNWKDVVKK